MPTGVLRGRTWNHNGTVVWPNCTVRLIRESDGVLLASETSDEVGYFKFVTADQITHHSVIADAPGVGAGIVSGVHGYGGGVPLGAWFDPYSLGSSTRMRIWYDPDSDTVRLSRTDPLSPAPPGSTLLMEG